VSAGHWALTRRGLRRQSDYPFCGSFFNYGRCLGCPHRWAWGAGLRYANLGNRVCHDNYALRLLGAMPPRGVGRAVGISLWLVSLCVRFSARAATHFHITCTSYIVHDRYVTPTIAGAPAELSAVLFGHRSRCWPSPRLATELIRPACPNGRSRASRRALCPPSVAGTRFRAAQGPCPPEVSFYAQGGGSVARPTPCQAPAAAACM